MVPAVGDETLDLLPRGLGGHRDDVRPRRHHLAHQHFVQLQNAAHHRRLFFFEDPLFLAGFEKGLHLLVRSFVVRLRGERETAPQEVAERLGEGADEPFPAAEPGQERKQHVFRVAQQDGGRNQFPEDEPRRDEDAEGPQEARSAETHPIEHEAEERAGHQETETSRDEHHERVRQAFPQRARFLDAFAESPDRDGAGREERDLEEGEENDEEAGDQQEREPEDHGLIPEQSVP